MYSILNKVNNAKIVQDPFPYLVIDDALPLNYYNKLDDSYPEYSMIIDNEYSKKLGLNKYKQNYAYRYNAFQSLKNKKKIADIWIDFITYHTSFEFVDEFYKCFGQLIYKYYPKSKGRLPTKENTGVRFLGKNYFNLDCQFVINTPAEKESSVIEPHLDNPKEFYAALFYMKNFDDNSTGGNLVVYKFKDLPKFYGKSRVKYENVIKIEEIEYKPNRLIMFLNTPYSIHGVTQKSISTHYRKYLNFIGEFNFELFNFRQFVEK